MAKEDHFTPNGLKLIGAYEQERNREHAECFRAILREVFGANETIVGHHIIYVTNEIRRDEKGRNFVYEIVEELPAADTLIFDHGIAERIWGKDFKSVLAQLACEPPETRDQLMSKLYYGRCNHTLAECGLQGTA